VLERGVLRTIDVNFNRSKEGLRVIEDIFRFVFEENSLRRKARSLRHQLDILAKEKVLKKAILNRDSDKDIGKAVDSFERARLNAKDIVYANFQRTKESLRVLEEFFKLLLPNRVSTVKKIRYQVYSLEKKTIEKLPRYK